MEVLQTFLQLFCLFVSLALSIFALFHLYGERRVGLDSTVFSILITAVMLPLFLFLSGAQLKLFLGLPLLILGMFVGFLWGYTMRLVCRNGQTFVHYSLLFIGGWLGSWILVEVFGFVRSVLLVTLGLVPVYLSTGATMGMNLNLLVRRWRMRRALALALTPPTLPEQAHTTRMPASNLPESRAPLADGFPK
jgi:hypothetical protein